MIFKILPSLPAVLLVYPLQLQGPRQTHTQQGGGFGTTTATTSIGTAVWMGGLSAISGQGYHRALLSSLRTATISDVPYTKLQGPGRRLGLFSNTRHNSPPHHHRGSRQTQRAKCKGAGLDQLSHCACPCSALASSLRHASKVETDWAASRASTSSTRLFSTSRKLAWTNTYVAREAGSESLVLESGAMVKRKLYAVKRGRQPGLYNTWKEAEEQVKGYRNAVHRAFSSKKEAETFLGTSSAPAVEAADEEKPSTVASSAASKPKPSPKKERKTTASASTKEAARKSRATLGQQERAGEYHIMQFDGGARGNPGIAGAGVVLLSPDGKVIEKKSLFLGDKVTNNQAEYQALIMGLQLGLDLGYKNLEVEGDSELVINQVCGNYEVKNKQLEALMSQVVEVLEQMENIIMRHIPRNENKMADELANIAMDSMSSD